MSKTRSQLTKRANYWFFKDILQFAADGLDFATGQKSELKALNRKYHLSTGLEGTQEGQDLDFLDTSARGACSKIETAWEHAEPEGSSR